jgi:hypothetical protein
MVTSAVAVVLAVLVAAASPQNAAAASRDVRDPVRHRIGATVVEGASDRVLWERVLDLLPERPERIVIVDLDALDPAARERIRKLEAFVLTGIAAVLVVRQGQTLQQAERESGVHALALASIVWHEMAHLDGLDEAAAIAREQELWRRWRAFGRVDGELALTYIDRLQRSLGRSGGRTATN